MIATTAKDFGAEMFKLRDSVKTNQKFGCYLSVNSSISQGLKDSFKV